MYAGKYDWNADFAKNNQQKYDLCVNIGIMIYFMKQKRRIGYEVSFRR